MLVIDQFNELVGLETLFRRLGFDVLSLGRESLVAEAVLGFQADLVIATGRGRNVDGLKLAPKLRHGTSQPKLVVLLPYDSARPVGEQPGMSHADVDAVIETPFDPKSALKIVATLLNMPPDPLLEKYTKIVSARLFEPEELRVLKQTPAATPLIHITSEGIARPGAGTSGTGGHAGPSSSSSDDLQDVAKPMTAREARYAKYLDDKAEEELPPIANADAMKDARKKLEASEAAAPIDEAQKRALLDRERREFVRAMMEAGQPETAAADGAGAADGTGAPVETKKK